MSAFEVYEYIGNFMGGFSRVKRNNKWGFVNEKGEEVGEIKYDLVGFFNSGFAPVMLNNKWGIIDATGKEICEVKYEWLWTFNEKGFALAKLGDKYCYIDKNGCQYDEKMLLTIL